MDFVSSQWAIQALLGVTSSNATISFMQGVVTVVIAALAAIFIIDFPYVPLTIPLFPSSFLGLSTFLESYIGVNRTLREHASKVRWPPKFLTEREAELVVAQINKDRSDVAAER